MSLLHGSARGSYRQFFSDGLKLFRVFIPDHLIFARRCKGQLWAIFSDCPEATLFRLLFAGHVIYCAVVQGTVVGNLFGLPKVISWRFQFGSFHCRTVVQGATTANYFGLC